MQPKTLRGMVEADETYFLHSKKGSRHLDRPSCKRGGKASKRGLSDEQVPVLIARDRDKATADRILSDRSETSIAGMLGPMISCGGVLVSDDDGSIIRQRKCLRFRNRQLPSLR